MAVIEFDDRDLDNLVEVFEGVLKRRCFVRLLTADYKGTTIYRVEAYALQDSFIFGDNWDWGNPYNDVVTHHFTLEEAMRKLRSYEDTWLKPQTQP